MRQTGIDPDRLQRPVERGPRQLGTIGPECESNATEARSALRNADPVGAGSTPRFALFAHSRPEGVELVGRHREMLEPEIRAPFDEGGIWLVRPDGYVAMVAGRGGWADIDDYLQRVAAAPNQGFFTL